MDTVRGNNSNIAGPSRNSSNEEIIDAGNVEKFTIISDSERLNRNFRTILRELIIKINDSINNVNQLVWLENTMREIVTYLKRGHDDTVIGIPINCSDFTQGSAGLYFRPIATLEFKDLWYLFGRISQSIKDFKLDDTFTLAASYIKVPNGSGDPPINNNCKKLNTRAILNIQNSDNMLTASISLR